MMNASEKAKQESYSLQLVTAADSAGEPFYAYLVVPQKLVPDFQQHLKSGAVELEKYGIVLASGKGHTPSQEHTDYIQERFGK